MKVKITAFVFQLVNFEIVVKYYSKRIEVFAIVRLEKCLFMMVFWCLSSYDFVFKSVE